MTPVAEIIENVVLQMKPDLSTASVDAVGHLATFTDVPLKEMAKIFVGQRMKISHSGVVKYGTVTTIFTTSFDATFPEMTYSGMSGDPLTLPGMILYYDHGHLLEMKNRFIEITQNLTYKQEAFPAIILIQDFQEKINRRKSERLASLRILILTDSKQEYSAKQRYQYTLKPTLYKLEELFIQHLEKSNEVSIYDQNYERYDHLYWGRAEGQGTASNIFSDFIDAIELNNLQVQILKTC